MLADDTLTHNGVPANRARRILLIACGALAREIIDLTKSNGWDHISLTCLPAILHNHPDRITDAVRAAVARHRPAHDRIYVVYADCGTGGALQNLCAELGVEMVPGPHCYSFFEGNAGFAAKGDDDLTTFYLTDFLARHFDAFVWKPLGLDHHPDLREMYFGHYTKLVYQAQTDDAVLTQKARGCADKLGLAFERRFTGYGDLATTLAGWVTEQSNSGLNDEPAATVRTRAIIARNPLDR